MGKIAACLLPFIGAFVLLMAGPGKALAVPPDWAKNKEDPPVSVPEPVVLTLIGMGASAAVGYYLGKRKK